MQRSMRPIRQNSFRPQVESRTNTMSSMPSRNMSLSSSRMMPSTSMNSSSHRSLSSQLSVNTKQHTLSQTSSLAQSMHKRSFHSSRATFSDAAVADAKPVIDDVPPQVTKIVEDIKQLNIMHTLQLVKLLKAEFGYNDAAFAMAAPVAAAPAGGAAAAAEEEAKPAAAAKTIFNLKLESFDASSKVKVIKEVRTISGLGLKEAKELVESAPQILKKEIKKEEGEKLIELLKEVGAVCVLE